MRALCALAIASISLVGCLDAPDEPSVVSTDLNGDTWTTVDDVAYPEGLGASYSGVAVAPNGHVWVIGSRTDTDQTETWLVRESTNGGASFGFNSAFAYPGGGIATVPTGIAIDSAGRIVISGWAIDPSNNSHWITRRSTDDGQSWQTVDDWVPTGTEGANAITIDDNDNIFVGGGGQLSSGDSYWKVRFSKDHGTTWSQFDFEDEGPFDGIGGYLIGMCLNHGDLWSVGSRPVGLDTDGLVVRDSSRGIDTEVTNKAWEANGCGGNGGTDPLFVAGQILPQPSLDAHWLVQRSVDGGPLTNVDDISSGNDINAAFDVRPGDAGTIYAVGTVGLHWRVRKTTDGTTWVNSDDLSYAAGEISQAQALKYWPATGHTFVVGWATDSSSRSHAVVRRR